MFMIANPDNKQRNSSYCLFLLVIYNISGTKKYLIFMRGDSRNLPAIQKRTAFSIRLRMVSLNGLYPYWHKRGKDMNFDERPGGIRKAI